jgi:hypothetical protein
MVACWVHSLLTIAFIADLEELARVPQSRLAFEEGGANIHRVPILRPYLKAPRNYLPAVSEMRGERETRYSSSLGARTRALV